MRGHQVSALSLGGIIPWKGEEGGTGWWQEEALVRGLSSLSANACWAWT